jgi:hypothetical protein
VVVGTAPTSLAVGTYFFSVERGHPAKISVKLSGSPLEENQRGQNAKNRKILDMFDDSPAPAGLYRMFVWSILFAY